MWLFCFLRWQKVQLISWFFKSTYEYYNLPYITHKRICFHWTDYQAVVLIHLLVCISIRWGRLLLWLLDTNEEINMQIFRLLLAVESLCFVSHGIVLTVSHAIETLVGCSHKQILWLLVFRRRVRTGSSILLLICFGFALRWRFREKIYRTIGSGGNLKDFLSSSFEFSRLLSNYKNS